MRVETLMGLERFEDCHDCRPYDYFKWAEDSSEWAEGSSEWADWPKVKRSDSLPLDGVITGI